MHVLNAPQLVQKIGNLGFLSVGRRPLFGNEPRTTDKYSRTLDPQAHALVGKIINFSL